MVLHAHCEKEARWMADQMIEVTGRDPLAVLDISPVLVFMPDLVHWQLLSW